MSLQDPIADMLTRVRNAQKASKVSVKMPASKQKSRIAEVLKDQGYISDYNVSDDKLKQLIIELKYYQGKPVIEEVKRISRPGLRIFKSKDERGYDRRSGTRCWFRWRSHLYGCLG